MFGLQNKVKCYIFGELSLVGHKTHKAKNCPTVAKKLLYFFACEVGPLLVICFSDFIYLLFCIVMKEQRYLLERLSIAR